MLTQETVHDRIRFLLEKDRVWSAYALADLSPSEVGHSEWLLGDSAVVLIYHGLIPPLIFATGSPRELTELFKKLRPGTYQYALLGTYRSLLEGRLRPKRELHMWRMVLKPEDLAPGSGKGAVRLDSSDLPTLLELFDDHADRPDAFLARQLETGIFFGVQHGSELLSVAGTHVVAPQVAVAAIGNVFTRPDHRGRGLAGTVTAAVAEELLRQGISTIVLNVSMDNKPAIRCYRRLGFWPFCGYYEGYGTLIEDYRA